MKMKSLLLAHPAALIAALLIALGAAGAVVPVFKATEKPGFCISCHEMKPYYDAWQSGAHKNVDCVACHVDPGTVNHVKHKATATKELVDHFTTTPTFPRGDAEVPDSRCLTCHKDILSSTGPAFSHKRHAGAAPCVQCHRDAGHRVSLDALRKAGVLAPASVSTSETTTTALLTTMTSSGAAASRSKVATSALHVAIPQCTQCHNLDKQRCDTCHKPLHKVLPTANSCSSCHRPGIKWAFTHPADEPACAACHKSPANHFPGQCSTCHHSPGASFKNASYGHTDPACTSCHTAPAKHRDGQCTTCHRNAGANWVFTHPAGGSCSTCHSAPAGHRSGACENCHRNAGSNWKFTHPASGSCGSCHKAPAGHRGGSCENCHRNAGRSWTFTHPTSIQCSTCHAAPGGHYGSSCSNCHRVGVPFKSAKIVHNLSLDCTGCHARPGGHRGGQCSTCHRNAGSSWGFTHPTSTTCSSCHAAPGGHYGSTCSSCHSPGRAFASATINHPTVHHGWKAWACVKCHPNGYASHSCTTCHGPNGGGG